MFLISGTDFSLSEPAIILLLCIHVARDRSMLILVMFSKDVLQIQLWYIHPYPCLQLWSAVACLNIALLLLQNVPGRLFTCYSILPRLLQLIHSCYVFSLAMVSIINTPSCCRYACFVMHCFVVSESSSPRCLHNSVYCHALFSAV